MNLKIIIFALLLVLPLILFAENRIECVFDRFHQVNHTNPNLNGYVEINQSMVIQAMETSKQTLALDGGKRATNSSSWIKLKLEGWETFTSSFAGNFGELLTVKHELGENKKGLKGWYPASLVESDVTTTHTLLGKCLFR